MKIKALLLIIISLALLSSSACDKKEEIKYGSITGRGITAEYGPKEEKIVIQPTKDNSAYVKSFGAIGDGVTDDSGSFIKALDSIRQRGYLFLDKGSYLIGKDITVPADVVISFDDDANIAVAKDKVLTIKGYVEAGISHIFKGEGTVEGLIRNAGYPQWFGISDPVDDIPVFRKAIKALKVMKVPVIERPYEVCNLIIDHEILIQGEGSVRTDLVFPKAGRRLFDIKSSNVMIKNFFIRGNEETESTVFYFNTEENDLQNVSVSNIWARSVGFFLRDSESDEFVINNVDLKDLRADLAKETGIQMTDFRKGIHLNCIQIQNLGAGFRVTRPGMIFANIEDMYMADIDVVGGKKNGTGANALVFENCRNVTLDRADMEAVNGASLVMKDCSGFEINHWVSGVQDGEGLILVNVKNSIFNLFLILGENYPGTPYKASEFGETAPSNVFIDCCDGLIFNGLNLNRGFGDAIILSNTKNNVINGLTISQMDGNGYVETGDSDSNTVNGLACGDIKGLSVVQKGSSSRILGAVLKNGTYINEISGPAGK
ncbi:MAG: hypothetical protein ACYCYM_09470 [Saccharofermentanales bacterium]